MEFRLADDAPLRDDLLAQVRRHHPRIDADGLDGIRHLLEGLATNGIEGVLGPATEGAAAARGRGRPRKLDAGPGPVDSRLPDWSLIREDSPRLDPCRRHVLAIGATQRHGLRLPGSLHLARAVVALLDCYARSNQTVRIGVLLTNVWRPEDVDEQRPAFRHFREQHGIETVALLASASHLVWVPLA